MAIEKAIYTARAKAMEGFGVAVAMTFIHQALKESLQRNW
jgi:hypothetical protein